MLVFDFDLIICFLSSRFISKMAPLSTAERQMRWRERLKDAGEYSKYQAKNADCSKKYRMKITV